MTKFISTAALLASCTYIRDKITRVSVCTTAAITDVASVDGAQLAVDTLTTGASTSWTIADGDVSGKKITMTARTTIAVAATGIAGQIVFDSTAGDTGVWYVTDCAPEVLGSTANKVTIPAWDIEFRQAT